jgi:hypothetical protein
MVDLILRPSGLIEKINRPWSLELRSHESCGQTEYRTLVCVDDNTAQTIIPAGAPYGLFGEPGWKRRAQERILEKVRALEEEAAALRAGIQN